MATAFRSPGRDLEDAAMLILGEAVRERAVCPTSGEMAERMKIALSTVPTVLRRLEERGLITRQVFQRGRQVTIVATGRSTAMPSNTSPHWRNRPKTVLVATPSLDFLRRRKPDVMVQIMVAARRAGKPLNDFLMDLIFAGFGMYEPDEQS